MFPYICDVYYSQTIAVLKNRAGRSLAQRGPLFAVPAGFSPHSYPQHNVYGKIGFPVATRAAAIDGWRARIVASKKGSAYLLRIFLRQIAASKEAARAAASGGGGSLQLTSAGCNSQLFACNYFETNCDFFEAERASAVFDPKTLLLYNFAANNRGTNATRACKTLK